MERVTCRFAGLAMRRQESPLPDQEDKPWEVLTRVPDEWLPIERSADVVRELIGVPEFVLASHQRPRSLGESLEVNLCATDTRASAVSVRVPVSVARRGTRLTPG